ncbi:MAG: HD-GYP domain-containing protein [Acidobacteriia bacterium]|nr:HD-GYP domain-containing protein [Terriglobia bacterium]
MGKKWIDRAAETNKELLLIFSIIAFAGIVNRFVAGQRLILTFYCLPTLFAAYYFGRRRAVQTAIASILIVCWIDVLNPATLSSNLHAELGHLMALSDLTIWGSFLLITAYAAGTLHEKEERALREVRDTYYGVLQILNQFISNDKYTQNHSFRVSVYATQIAQNMGFSGDRVEDVRAAALLHDIGKLETSREVLYKAARLTDDEMIEIKTHVEKGVAFLSPVGSSLRRILPIILAHHDKFDGTGYHATQGEDIPLEARIISVADVYDSLISDRPYRKGMSPYEARDILLQGSGKDFDPAVLKAFDAAFRNQQMEVPEVLA